MIVALSCAAAMLVSATDVVARVDGVDLKLSEVLERVAEMRTSSREQGLESLVLDVVMSGEARASGLEKTAAVREQIARERRRIAAAFLAEKEAAALPAPSQDELERMYHATADAARLKMLVFPTEDAARVNLALVQRSGNFDDAARSAVPGIEAASGTRMQIRGELPPRVAEAAFRAPLGAAVGPVELEDGWAILKVLERNVGDANGFAVRRASLEKFAREQMGEAMRQHLRERLRKAAKITTDDAFLDVVSRRPQPTPADLDHVAATVNGAPIRYRDVEASIRQLASATGHVPSPGLRRQLLTREIEDRLLEQAAVDQGLLGHAVVAERAGRAERRILAAALVDQVTAAVPAPTAKEVEAFYRANVARTGQSLDAARAQIAQQLLDARRGEALRARVEPLRARAAVTVNSQALQAHAG